MGQDDIDASAPLLPTLHTTATPSRKSRPFIAVVSLGLAGIGAIALLFFWWTSADSTGRGSPADPWPTFIGYAGPTPTGAEAQAAETSYPKNYDSYPLHPPSTIPASTNFNLLHNLGNLAPWRSVDHGLAASTSAQVPKGCTVDQVHLLHRHGARYPTSYAGASKFARKIEQAKTGRFKAHGVLEFLNDWTYKLGAEILTPFGREQLFNLGVGFRVKYGALLDPSTSSNYRKPVFRTESQDRMLKSALNFAAGFFGIPFEDQYHQLITVEAAGFNNTLAPYMTCRNANDPKLMLTSQKMNEWRGIYLKDAAARLTKLVEGVELTVQDAFDMQEMCAYEIVALSGSVFCDLFTEREWESFEYALDLEFYYSFSFGQPASAAMGLGWTQEWLSRVTGERITEFNSTVNSTIASSELYFPLDGGQKIFVDATHDTIVSAVLTTLNFASFAKSGPMPSTHIPANHSFVTSKISPFAANLHAQIISCPAPSANAGSSTKEQYVRWILNDGVIPLESIDGCGNDAEGKCKLSTFVESTRARINTIDWAYDCLGDYELGVEEIRDGRPASRAT